MGSRIAFSPSRETAQGQPKLPLVRTRFSISIVRVDSDEDKSVYSVRSAIAAAAAFVLTDSIPFSIAEFDE